MPSAALRWSMPPAYPVRTQIPRRLRSAGREIRGAGALGRRLGPAQRLEEQPPQGGALLGVEGSENFVLDRLLSVDGVLESRSAGFGDEDAVASAVLGIPPADEMAAVLELVEQQHHVLGVDTQ